MLQMLNKFINKWVIIVVVSVITLAFMFWGVQYYIEAETGQQAAVAKVDGSKITEKDLNDVYQSLQRRVQQQQGGVALTSDQQQQLKEYALQNLIQQKALNHAASKQGLYVSLEQAQQMIEQDPDFQSNGRFDSSRLQQLVYTNGMTMQQFFHQFQKNLLTQQMLAGIQNSAFVLPQEVQQAYRLIKQTRNFGYLLLSPKQYNSKVTVTDKDIQHFYQQHKAQFQTPEQVSIDYIVLSPKAFSHKVQVTDAELKVYYQANQINYTIPKRWRIQKIEVTKQSQMQQIEQLLKQGHSFDSVAKQFDSSQATAQWLSQAEISTQLADFLTKLSVQQLSAPFRTSKGYAIIKLLEVQAAKVRPFAEIRSRLHKTLLQQKLDQLLSQKNEQLSNLTYTNPNSLTAAAKALDVSVQHSPLFERHSKLSGVLADPKIVAAAFSKDVLSQEINSNPISLKDGSLIVLRVDKHIPSKTLPLTEVKAKVKAQLQQQIANRLAGLDAYKVQTALQNNTAGAVLAQQYASRWHQVTRVSRDDKTLNQQIVQTAFATALHHSNTVQLNNGQFAVVYVDTLVAPAAELDTKARLSLQQRLQSLWGQLAYQFYIKSVMQQAKIDVLDKSMQ